MNLIHPSAVISDGAVIGDNVKIGPFCVVGDDVVLDEGVELKSHVVVDGLTHIGAGTVIHPFASIGGAPQDLKYAGEKTKLIIGKNNTIREHVTMNPGTVSGLSETRVGDNGLFMMGAHVAHDCVIGDHVIFANNATVAGHVVIGNYVILGGLSAVHQFIRIGDHAIIGGMSGVESDVIPFGRVKGERAGLAGLNLIGLERKGVAKAEIKILQKLFNHIFSGQGTLDQRLSSAQQDFAEYDVAAPLLEFLQAESKFPLCQPLRK